jgi:hypothetical protein
MKQRLDHIEEQLREFKADIKESFGKAERDAERRHQEMLDKIRVTVDYTVVLERLARIEEEQKRLKQ